MGLCSVGVGQTGEVEQEEEGDEGNEEVEMREW